MNSLGIGLQKSEPTSALNSVDFPTFVQPRMYTSPSGEKRREKDVHLT